MKFFLRFVCALCAACLLLGGCALAVEDYSNENSTRGFVYRMYDIVLGRVPEEDGFNFWVDKLEKGELKAADLVQGFLGSEEYAGFGKSNAQVVTDCYNAMLNRNPDPGGFDFWKSRLDIGMTFQTVCAGFVGSVEFNNLAKQYGIAPGTITVTNARDTNYERTAFVYRMYNDCLGRNPETDGLEHWCDQLNQGMSGTSLAENFVFSAEFLMKHLSNAEFVKVMYRTILGRESDAGGLAYWKEKLDYTNTREFVLNGFMASAEFSEACETSGIKVGNPIATPDNTDEWKINIELLNIFNDQRRALGIPDLTTREDLWRDVSMVRVNEIKTYHSSYRPDGRWWSSIINDSGLGYIDYNGTGEKESTATVWENYCYDMDEPISYWFSYPDAHPYEKSFLRE